MGAQLRVYRRRIRTVQSTKKITKAMELIAASRIIKAQARVAASTPYAEEITRAVSALASFSNAEHPLITEKEERTRAAMLLVTSDRGLAGAYSSNAIKEGEALTELLRGEGKEVRPYLVGRKAIGFYRFRQRETAAQWSGFSDSPEYAHAKEISERLINDFLTPTEEGGVDEIHVVSTRFVSMMTQTPAVRRLIPLEVVEAEDVPEDVIYPLYDFEPSAEQVLDALLPRYIESRVYNALLQAAASEHAARRRAMKAATDNAEDLVRTLTRLANAARQAEITQEISEIVGGANALADASTGSE
ncbi:MAG: F0F1 ATP synthase subunit gamma [Sporichthyaceae bacterium]|nr:F0F1 ATP synthase subunit gamma [Sporichthyaceae bacterium]